MSNYTPYQRPGMPVLYGVAAFQARLKDEGGIQRHDQHLYLQGWRDGYAEHNDDIRALQRQVQQLSELIQARVV